MSFHDQCDNVPPVPKIRASTDAEWRKYYEDKCREQRKELEIASDLLADVYAQVGNHRPPTIRHALTPGLRDGIRDFLHARKTIVVKPTRDDLRNIIEDLYGAFECKQDKLSDDLRDQIREVLKGDV